MILVLDNHDSFTFNLVQALGTLGAEVQVRASDAIDLAGIEALSPAGILISPGPGRPAGAGVSMQVVKELGARVPLLGVCLGHQALCEALGARVVHAQALVHGRTSRVHHDGRGLFLGLPQPFLAARYHSLVVESQSLPECLEACAFTEAGELMAVRHRSFPLHGVQFHPESFLTELGPRLLQNFLHLTDAHVLLRSVEDLAHG